jgi:hypothetical protein
MSTKTLQQRIAFIQGLKLAPIDPALRPTFRIKRIAAVSVPQQPKKISASVNGGSVVSFTANLSDQNKSDVLNSTLLAQIAANKKHSRTDDPVNWYKYYFKVLTYCGWIIQCDTFLPYTESGKTVKIEEAVIRLLSAIASQQVVLIVKEALAALKKLSKDDRRFVIWDKNTHSKTAGNFQLQGATVEGSSIALNATNMYFTSNQTDTKFLWFSFSKAVISLQYNNQTLTLNQDVYSALRSEVLQKIKNHAPANIKNLDV